VRCLLEVIGNLICVFGHLFRPSGRAREKSAGSFENREATRGMRHPPHKNPGLYGWYRPGFLCAELDRRFDLSAGDDQNEHSY
jgi:hypothetical protein